MLSHGCVGPYTNMRVLFANQGVKQVTHAVQLLKLERCLAILRRLNDLSYGARVVSSELAEDAWTRQ